MKRSFLFFALVSIYYGSSQSFTNALKIPYTLSGTNISLRIHDSVTQFFPGQNTNTRCYGGMTYLGPTLVLDKDSVVSFSITNNLTDSTTVHWHGLHVPAEWDGGPMNFIVPGQVWNPQFKIMNNASTMWYHSHMDMETHEQVTKGLAGMIIIRDSAEQQLNLPRTYGTDDIPLVFQDRDFDGSFQMQNPPLGSTMVVNGTVSPYVNCPAQVVRLRLLNGSSERSYMIGFDDNRTFNQIGIDGGLLEAPVSMNRLRISPGERAELLIDLSSDLNDSLFIMNYGTELGNTVSGGFSFGPGGGIGPLDSTDTKIIKITVSSPTTSPITTIPSALSTINFLDTTLTTVIRKKILTDPLFPGGPFTIDSLDFDMSAINDTILLGATEIWEITNASGLLHPMHIHDVAFNILSRNGNPPPANELGWKDVVDVDADETVRLVAKFDDFADSMYTYMFHCHLLDHEDHGMMHQFIVLDPAATGVHKAEPGNFSFYPNPATNKIFIEPSSAQDFEVAIFSLSGKKVAVYRNTKEITISELDPGLYFMRFSDGQEIITRKFIKY
jgi:blue copper oxidase